MNTNYQKIISYILSEGRKLKQKSGNIKDIGITKAYLTKEDLKIEQGFSQIIKSFGNNHILFAEERHNILQDAENIWIVDPISGTASFIKGLAHYAIVVSHLYKGEIVFAAVYDPAVDELFTAFKGGGSFLNGKQIKVTHKTGGKPRVIFNLSLGWKNFSKAEKVCSKLFDFVTYRNTNSFAVNYCYVACSRFDGVITLNKDNFPEFAGSLIINEAGGKFTSINDKVGIELDDRVFVGGNETVYEKLKSLVKSVF